MFYGKQKKRELYIPDSEIKMNSNINRVVTIDIASPTKSNKRLINVVVR